MDNLMPCTLFFCSVSLFTVLNVDCGRGEELFSFGSRHGRTQTTKEGRGAGGGLPRTTDERTRNIFASTFLHAITIVREFIITRSSSLVILNI